MLNGEQMLPPPRPCADQDTDTQTHRHADTHSEAREGSAARCSGDKYVCDSHRNKKGGINAYKQDKKTGLAAGEKGGKGGGRRRERVGGEAEEYLEHMHVKKERERARA